MHVVTQKISKISKHENSVAPNPPTPPPNIFDPSAHVWKMDYIPVRHGEYSENLVKDSLAVKQVPTGSRLLLLIEK
jgi:hypothetical protein